MALLVRVRVRVRVAVRVRVRVRVNPSHATLTLTLILSNLPEEEVPRAPRVAEAARHHRGELRNHRAAVNDRVLPLLT